MKMFVTSAEVVKQNNNLYSSRRLRQTDLGNQSQALTFNNNTSNSSRKGCDEKPECSHSIDYFKEDLLAQVKESNSVDSDMSATLCVNNLLHDTMSRSILQDKQEIALNCLLSTTKQNMKGTSSSSSSTQAMSLPSSHVLRTKSEFQLCEDIAAAEWRDNCMFNRLVHGMKEKQEIRSQRRSRSNYPSANATFNLGENSDSRIERSLTNIVRHRYKDLQEVFPVDASSLRSLDNYSGGGNVIEPDEEDAFEVFEMDDL